MTCQAALYSMTGFGSARAPCMDQIVQVALKTVNHRTLKVTARLAFATVPLELELERMARTALKRGHLSISVTCEGPPLGRHPTINEAAVRAYQQTFARLGLLHEAIATLPGVIETAITGQADATGLQQAARQAAQEALAALLARRAQEGDALRHVLIGHCEALKSACGAMRPRGPVDAQAYQRRLTQRLDRLLGELAAPVHLDAAVLASHVALFAERCDITEECDRLVAHLDAAHQALVAGGEIGRKLEFLAQEMHREVNTMGSKAADLGTSRLVLACKAELERFKEQVANVE